METSQSIQNRSSCREFSSKEIPSQYIKEILEAARYAPSPKNRQPWRFVVLRGEDKKEFVELISVPQNANMYFSLKSKELKEQDSYNNSYHIIQEADTMVLVFNCYPSNFALNEPNTLFDITNIQSIGAAIQNMLLKATDLGIGSLWMCDIFSHYNYVITTILLNNSLQQ